MEVTSDHPSFLRSWLSERPTNERLGKALSSAKAQPPAFHFALKSTLVCICLPCVALVVGGAVMSMLEHPDEKKRLETFSTYYQELLNVTKEIEVQLNHTLLTTKLEKFMDHISPYLTSKVSIPDENRSHWNLEGSIFFCWTIMTTIGYGGSAPSTVPGKIFIIFYTIVTVPLFLVSMAHLSSSFSRGAEAVAARFDWPATIRVKYFAILVASLALLFILGLAIPFSVLQSGWSYLDGVYFGIISLSTVGLGDKIPSTDKISILGFMVYSFVGLVLVGTIASSGATFYDQFAHFLADHAVAHNKTCRRKPLSETFPTALLPLRLAAKKNGLSTRTSSRTSMMTASPGSSNNK